MASSTIGTAVIKLSFDGKDVNAQLTKVGSSMQKTGTNTGTLFANAWTVAAGNIIAKGISTLTSTISNNLSKAIQRADIINNFPKVMANMNISAEDAQASISLLSKKLDGLPTSLQSAVSAVQRLTSKNADVAKSTQIFLALNNAILAGGASSEIQASAIEQLSQAYAKGKPDMLEWRTMQQAMPAQLRQVALAMGFGADGVDQLGESLRNGSVSMDDFMDTMVKLNNDGVDGFLNFEEQARNSTSGIGTAVENVKNRIAKAMEKVIDHVGSENIAKALDKISEKFDGVADIVNNIIDFLRENKWVTDFILNATGVLLGLATAMWIVNAAMNANPIVLIVTGVGLLIAGIITLVQHFDEVSEWIHTNLPWLGDILDFIGELIDNIGKVVKVVIDVIAAIFNNVIIPIWSKIAEFLGPFIKRLFDNLVLTIQVIATVFSNVFNVVSTIVKGVFDFIVSIFTNIGSFVGGVVNGIRGFFEGLGNAIGTIFNGIREVVSTVFGVIASIIKAPINGIIGAINGVLSFINSISVPDWVPIIGGAHTNFGMIPYLARGGVVSSPTIAMIGEQGKEAVIPLENHTDNWAGTLASILTDKMDMQDLPKGTTIVVNMTNEISNEMDAADIGRKLMQSIRRAA